LVSVHIAVHVYFVVCCIVTRTLHSCVSLHYSQLWFKRYLMILDNFLIISFHWIVTELLNSMLITKILIQHALQTFIHWCMQKPRPRKFHRDAGLDGMLPGNLIAPSVLQWQNGEEMQCSFGWLFSRTLQFHCCHVMSFVCLSSVCLWRQCVVTKQLKLGSCSFH